MRFKAQGNILHNGLVLVSGDVFEADNESLKVLLASGAVIETDEKANKELPKVGKSLKLELQKIKKTKLIKE